MNHTTQRNIELLEKIDSLTLENTRLKRYIGSLQELLGSDICKFFEICYSIKQTKKRFCYDSLATCYRDLVYFFGDSDTVQRAVDFKECYKDIFGTDYQSDTDNYSDSDTNIEIEDDGHIENIENTNNENISDNNTNSDSSY